MPKLTNEQLQEGRRFVRPPMSFIYPVILGPESCHQKRASRSHSFSNLAWPWHLGWGLLRPMMTSWQLVSGFFVGLIIALPGTGLSGAGSGELSPFSEARPLTVQLRLHGEIPSTSATLVMFDTRSGTWNVQNPQLAQVAQSPCSTFKIPNTLIGLETGNLETSQTVGKWDGVMRAREEENQDHTLHSAFHKSIVSFYQRLAERVGSESMAQWLQKLDYGNQDMSGGLTKFWLGSSLTISPVDQVRFLHRICTGGLKGVASEESLETLKEVMLVERWKSSVLYGKTGSRGAAGGGYDLGWYVGWVQRADGSCLIFACLMEGPEQWGPKARDGAREVLAKLGEFSPPELQ